MGPQDVAQEGGGVGHDPVNACRDESTHLRRVVDGPGVNGQPVRVSTPQISVGDQARGHLEPVGTRTQALGESWGSGPLEEDLGRAGGCLDGRRGPASCCPEPPRRERREAHPVPRAGAPQGIEDRRDDRCFLQVDVDRRVRVSLEQFLESHGELAIGEVGATNFVPRQRKHRSGHVGGSIQQRVVVDDGNAIAGGTHIRLEPGVAQGHGRRECGGGVLGGDLRTAPVRVGAKAVGHVAIVRPGPLSADAGGATIERQAPSSEGRYEHPDRHSDTGDLAAA